MSGPQRLPRWEDLAADIPDVVVTMRRYLDQISCILRPGSVSGADQALRSLAAFLTEQAPDVTGVADIHRRHLEDFRRRLADRPGRDTTRVSPPLEPSLTGSAPCGCSSSVSRSGTGPDAPARVPIIPADLPRQDHPLPKALDDATAAKLLRSAQTQPRMLVRVVVEVLLRTGLRVGEFTALQADAVVLIGAAHWLHVPVGKLHEDRYLPLHPPPRQPHRRLPCCHSQLAACATGLARCTPAKSAASSLSKGPTSQKPKAATPN
ncbi:hypothetical protein AAH979_40595 [Plantactinospora sp. ZYX-F-223]|uniref:hypothetical protein n=1 Tax=Plantactinospora sp. ZYX-F-223 TaxID=3144103 RepID=UPI0031FBC8D3